MKKKIMSMALAAVLAGSMLGGCGSSSDTASAGELNIFIWTEYVSQEAIDAFEKDTGIKVNVSTYSSNEDMIAKVKSESEGTYDIIQPSDYAVEQLSGQGMLEELDKEKLTNLGNIGESYLDPSYDPGNVYSVPYQGGVAAIAVLPR